MDVRRAVVADALELVRLQQVMLVASNGLDPARDDWQPAAREWLCARLAGTGDSFVAVVIDMPDASGRLAACAIGLVDHRPVGPGISTGEIGYIVNVVTDPAHRRRGYARACMEALFRWYQRRGVTQVRLRASAEGEPLYAVLGFSRSPEPLMELNIPLAEPHFAGSGRLAP